MHYVRYCDKAGGKEQKTETIARYAENQISNYVVNASDVGSRYVTVINESQLGHQENPGVPEYHKSHLNVTV